MHSKLEIGKIVKLQLIFLKIHLAILILANQWKNSFKLHSFGFFKGLLWDKYSVTTAASIHTTTLNSGRETKEI